MNRMNLNYFVSKGQKLGMVLVFLLFGALLGYAMFFRPSADPTDIQIIISDKDEASFIDQEWVSTWMKKAIVDAQKQGLDQKKAWLLWEKELNANPYILRSDVYVNHKGQLSVKIEQRKPLFRVIHNSGVSYYIDKEGHEMPISSNFTARVPVLTGWISAQQSLRNEQLSKVYNILNFIHEDRFWWSMTEQLVLNERGDVEWIPKLGNQVVILGDDQDLKGKFHRLKVFYHEIIPNSDPKICKTVNVKYKNQVICSKI